MSYFERPVASIHDLRILAARLYELADECESKEASKAYEHSAELTEAYGYEVERQEEGPDMATEAHKAANRRYDKTNTRQFVLKLNVNTDADVIEWLDRQDNKQGEIKWLIREQIRHDSEGPIRADVRRLIGVYGEEGLEPDIPEQS